MRVALRLVVLALVGCTDLAEGNALGDEGGHCLSNRSCNAGLTCLSDRCVKRLAKDRDASVEPKFEADSGSSGAGAAGSRAGTGGNVAAGSGGSGAGSGGIGGSSGDGSAGTTSTGGMGGGSAGAIGIGGAAGGGGQAGASVSGGSGGSVGTNPQCVLAVMTADPATAQVCAACLCDSCGAQLAAMDGDADAQALSACGRANACYGDCCFCDRPDGGVASGGEICGVENYRTGPCAAETEVAAGVPSPSTFANDGASLLTACTTAGNSCNKAVVLADCSKAHCATQCPAVAACK